MRVCFLLSFAVLFLIVSHPLAFKKDTDQRSVLSRAVWLKTLLPSGEERRKPPYPLWKLILDIPVLYRYYSVSTPILEGWKNNGENLMADTLIELSGLWLNTSKDGKTKYMTGYLGSARIKVFRNTYKTEDKHPDYIMYVAPPPPREDTENDDDDDVLF